MDVLTFHALMLGHTKRGNHGRVLQLYDEAVAANVVVSRGGAYTCGATGACLNGVLGCVPSLHLSFVVLVGAVSDITVSSYTERLHSNQLLTFVIAPF